MDAGGVLVCDRHHKHESNMAMISTNYYICMNRYCPNAYTILCSSCRQDHRDHTINVLTIEDICFLIDRLLKMPFKQIGFYMAETVEVMKKLQRIRQFKDKIDVLQTEIQNQTFSLIETTEGLISEYAHCKKAAHDSAEVIYDIEDPKSFQLFKSQTIKNLRHMDYNFQKDMMEYQSNEIKDRLEKRKKFARGIKRKIEEVKQYSMKIIEVILNDDESDEEEEDILFKKKEYEELKSQLIIVQEEDNLTSRTLSKRIEEEDFIPKTLSKRVEEEIAKSVHHFGVQTDKEKGKEKQQNSGSSAPGTKFKQMEAKLDMAAMANRKLQVQFKQKVHQLQKEKESLMKQKQAFGREKEKVVKQKDRGNKAHDKKIQVLTHLEKRLRDNRVKRIHRLREREDTIRKLIQYVEQQQRRESMSKEKKERNPESRMARKV